MSSIYAADQPATGEDVCGLVLPEVSTAVMSTFLAAFAQGLPAVQHAILVLEQAGWHGADTVTLVPLLPNSPELTPVKRVWLYLRESYLSHQLLADYEAVVEACCRAWNALAAETGRIKSPC